MRRKHAACGAFGVARGRNGRGLMPWPARHDKQHCDATANTTVTIKHAHACCDTRQTTWPGVRILTVAPVECHGDPSGIVLWSLGRPVGRSEHHGGFVVLLVVVIALSFGCMYGCLFVCSCLLVRTFVYMVFRLLRCCFLALPASAARVVWLSIGQNWSASMLRPAFKIMRCPQ